MSDAYDATPSADQAAWDSVWARVRDELAKQVPLIPAMTAAESKTFVETLGEALTSHMRAKLLDHKVERELARNVYWQD